MFELKFAITEQNSVSSQALALVSISSQPFSGWILNQRSMYEDHNISYTMQIVASGSDIYTHRVSQFYEPRSKLCRLTAQWRKALLIQRS